MSQQQKFGTCTPNTAQQTSIFSFRSKSFLFLVGFLVRPHVAGKCESPVANVTRERLLVRVDRPEVRLQMRALPEPHIALGAREGLVSGVG